MTNEQQKPREGFRFPPERRHVLMDEERRRRLPPEPILAAARIPSGVTVLDVGAGTGFWTLPLSRLAGPLGKVIAVDVEPIMLGELHDLVAAQGLTNVEVLPSEELRIPLPDGSADAAVLGFVLHEPSDPGAFVREIRRLVRPSGRILVLDWNKRETEQGPPVEHRLTEAEASELLRDAGYAVESLPSPHPDVYILLALEA